MKINVIITDDHPIVANGLKKVLKEFAHIEVVAVFATGKALLDGLKNTQADVLLLDFNLPDAEGSTIAKEALRTFPGLMIIVFSSLDVIVQVKKMLQLGCAGYLLKDADDTTIVKAIETVYAGGQFLSPSLEQRIVESMFKNRQEKHPSLTRREKEILGLILQEMTNQEIADKLFISLHTVDNHRSSLLQKLDVKNTAGLVKKAVEQGLVDG